MASETRTMASRHAIEERLRLEAYQVLDTAMLEPNNYEHMVWQDIHDELIRLAEFYESNGLKIWKH